ncbi:MAG: flavin reductase family protein [Candidatus Omnitrophota bacterium]|nr:flavin reductase family protein [Candidatus Omnitrophota bacterium]
MPAEILDIVTSPVTIVTARDGDKINGMTLSWIMQGAYNPAALIVSIAPERYTYSLIKNSKVFGVNILASDQKLLGRRFGFASGSKVDKFKGVKFHKSKSGLPVLDDVFAYIECKLLDIKNAGDHDLFIGEVVERIVDDSKKALVFKTSDYF